MASDVRGGAGGMERDETRAKQEIKEEQDRLAFGKSTADLEWDGIRKLDYPPPRWWVLTFWACFIFAVVWWVLYPSWPFFNTYSPGILGYDQREDVVRHLAAGKARQAVYLERIANQDTAAVQADPELRGFALVGGEVLFKENCAGCHGLGGAGQLAFPSLADDDWIWGGTLDAVEQTIRHGVRNGLDAEARDSIMPAFGADGILTRPQIEEVAQYVLSLTDRATNPEAVPRARRSSPRTASPATARAVPACRSRVPPPSTTRSGSTAATRTPSPPRSPAPSSGSCPSGRAASTTARSRCWRSMFTGSGAGCRAFAC